MASAAVDHEAVLEVGSPFGAIAVDTMPPLPNRGSSRTSTPAAPAASAAPAGRAIPTNTAASSRQERVRTRAAAYEWTIEVSL